MTAKMLLLKHTLVAVALYVSSTLLALVACTAAAAAAPDLILLDAGTGGWWGRPDFGRLLTNLRRAGYQSAQIDTVLITHLHADHVGGIATKAGVRVFSNAEVYVSKEDADFWLSPEKAAEAPQDARLFFQIARACTGPYTKAGRLHIFSGATDILEGVRAIPAPGHPQDIQFLSLAREHRFSGTGAM